MKRHLVCAKPVGCYVVELVRGSRVRVIWFVERDTADCCVKGVEAFRLDCEILKSGGHTLPVLDVCVDEQIWQTLKKRGHDRNRILAVECRS